MSPHPYTEDQLVEQPAIGLFDALGWQTVSALDETFGAIDELARDRSAISIETANREVYRLLKDGITVSVPDHEHGGQKTERLRIPGPGL